MAPNEERTRNNLIYSDIPLQSMRFLGHTTNTLSPSNGPSYIYTNSPHIYMDDGNAVCAETGDVVLDNDGRYFVYYLDRWVELEDKTADALPYTIAVDIATKLCDHPEEINTSLSIGVTVTDPENTEELVPPDLSDLLSLDDEQYKTKFNCDYEKHEVTCALKKFPEELKKSIITFYNFYHLKGKEANLYTQRHSITDYAMFMVCRMGTNPIARYRLHNICYILLGVLDACGIFPYIGIEAPICHNGGVLIPQLENNIRKGYWIYPESFNRGKPEELDTVDRAFAARVVEIFADYTSDQLIELIKSDGVWEDGLRKEIGCAQLMATYRKHIFGY